MNNTIAISQAPIEGSSTHRLSGVPAPPPLPRGRWPHPTRRDPYGLQRIADKTADAFDITCDFMLHGGKEERSSFPRMVAMFISLEKCSCNLNTIAHFFRKHYGTVLHARRAIQKRMDVDRNAARIVQEILKAL